MSESRRMPSPRVDAHHHVWSRGTRSWATGVLDRVFTNEHHRLLAAQAGIEHTVLVQTLGDRVETEQFLAIAAADDLIAGVVGWAELTLPSVGDDLDVLRAGPGGRKLSGIRYGMPGHLDEAGAHTPLIDGLRALAERDLSFDLLITPSLLPAALELVRAVPELRFVVDHLGVPDVVAGGFDAWYPGFAALAAHENVAVKLSGLPLQVGVHDLVPFVSAAFDAFGPERVMFGSDWPMCVAVGGYRVAVEVTQELIVGRAPVERDAVMGETARRWYRLAP
jgi:L-fuconolactonase